MANNEIFELRLYGDTVIQDRLNIPLIDAHMHIQSNDIAPLPIMYGLLNKLISRFIYEHIATQRDSLQNKMNFINLTYLDGCGDIGAISPVSGGGPFICEFSNRGIDVDIGNVKKELPAILQIMIGLSILNPLSIGLEWIASGLLNGDDNTKRQILTDVTALFMPYGKVTRQNSFLIAGIYKNDKINSSSMGYASRIQVTPDGRQSYNSEDVQAGKEERDQLIGERTDAGKVTPAFFRISRHYYGNPEINLRSGFTMSVIHGMELLYAHYWGAYGIPIYIPDNAGRLYQLSDNIVYRYGAWGEEKIYCAYDMPKETVSLVRRTGGGGRALNIGGMPAINTNDLGGSEKYCHFLRPVPGTEVYQYENLEKHLVYTQAAAVRYPLEYVPFYHVDPRRFFASYDKISKYHDFYLCGNNAITEIPGTWVENTLNENSVLKYRKDFDRDVKPLLLHRENGSWHPGLFWGIKMYAALGYPPYLFDTGKAGKTFRCLESGDYSGLIEFYNFCAEHEVPITCHGSPQGMTIADPGTYLKEFLKDNPGSGYENMETKINFPVDGKSFMNGIGLIDSFSSPGSWRVVLDKLKERGNHDKLILCLAHFGGKRYFSGEFPAESNNDGDTPYRWLKSIASLVNEFRGVYTDLSCFVYNKFVAFPRTIRSSLFSAVRDRMGDDFIRNVYRANPRNRSVYACNDGYVKEERDDAETLQKIALLRLELIQETPNYPDDLKEYDELYNSAETLARLLKDNKKLRHRILFGTDWPMTEMEVAGVSRYNSAIFVLLQLVTAKLGNEWDAWHQFAVINPLRFLGLLEDPDEGRDGYTLSFDKIDKMKAAIESYINTTVKNKSHDYITYYDMDDTFCTEALSNNYQLLKANYSREIPAAHKLTYANNTKLLLTGYPVNAGV